MAKKEREVRIVGERLRELRDMRGWSQAQIEMKTGIDQTYISDLERARRTNISLDFILRLADAFEMSAGEFIEQLMSRQTLIPDNR